ncbi:MAG TPA: LacI family DNA-binding transcriptional regulator [Fimbriimonadaceae bacterium]|jgi:LacI family transcriptional regulator/LacI family repressor for deo operon, udp, cdd, tsx, nupC, and nupG
MATTLKDIARKLNISQSTVSYALNGGPRSVPEELKERIVQTARELNYRPNRVARAMVTRRSHTIGVVFPELIDDPFSSVYHQLALNGIANAARQLNQDILLFTGYNGEGDEELISMMADGRVDGAVFIAPFAEQGTLVTNASQHLPCVIIAGEPPEGVSSFSVDNLMGVDQAMQHLYDLGHRKIAHVAGLLEMLDGRVRLEAYKHFLSKRNIPFRPEYIGCGQFMVQGGWGAGRTLLALENPPTAIVCADDLMATGVLYAALEAGVKVPEDLSVVGFGMIPGSADTYPPLTTVNHPVTELAAQAFNSLLAVVNGGEIPVTTVLDTELIVRSSTMNPKEDQS